MIPAACEHQTHQEPHGIDAARYTCSTFYCPYPGRECGVRMQVDEIFRLHGGGSEMMQVLISDERGPLTRVKCPRPLFPPVPLSVCQKCTWHWRIAIPTERKPCVKCAFGKTEGSAQDHIDAELVP